MAFPKDIHERIVSAKMLMEHHFHEPLVLEAISKQACLSPYHFHRLFNTIYRRTPHQYPTYLRMQKAEDLPEKEGISVTDICNDVGFESITSFSALFKKQNGYAPQYYRKLHTGKRNYQKSNPKIYSALLYSNLHMRPMQLIIFSRMKHFILIIAFCSFAIYVFAQFDIALQKGLVIHSSVMIKKDSYKISADTSLSSSLIVIDGNNITVDFNNAILQGTNDPTRPNQFTGLAVVVKKGSSNIVLKNANIRGYKIAVMADNVSSLTIENCDFSYNYRQQLHSNPEREDISDWMSYHHNEHDEWTRYGAGIYLKDCDNAIIKNNIAISGQCGLMMTRCNYAEVFDNNFSFNSGLGIGMYRSSNNRIYHNRLDFNVRGFHFGKYYRGQDSAGILVFEQSNNNLFGYNSVTHSGDGFFLWAGQHTMDTGEGGCNDNRVYGNDFSYAPTNGVEVTFSRNNIEKNIIKGCDHGVWGGYSFSTSISDNQFSDNRIAIAIEHGQHNQIFRNCFSNDKTAIKLWSRTSQPADWAYAQKRDTRSVGYSIDANKFDSLPLAFDIMGTDSVSLSGNTKIDCNTVYKFGERTTNIDSTNERITITDVSGNEPNTTDTRDILTLPATTFPQGRNQIRITEWGPYNFEYPILWLNNVDSNNIYHFEVLAKNDGNPIPGWKIKSVKGFTLIDKGNNNFPSTLSAKPDTTVQDRFIRLQYEGPEFKDALGNLHSGKKPYYFDYSEFDPLTKWNINFYRWDSIHNPVNNFEAFTKSLTTPFNSTVAKKVDYTWWGSIGKNLPADSFATVAIATINLPAGEYEIGITDDDLAKLFIDDKPVIDAWNTHYVDLDENTHHSDVLHLEGKHDLKIIHADISGLATLMFYIKPYRHL